jgi:predicted DNA-binding transcriptional regulator AlpA
MGYMPTKVPRVDEPKLTSSQVARLLGISQRTLFRKLKAGTIPEPARNASNRYRQWRPDEVPQLRELLKEES